MKQKKIINGFEFDSNTPDEVVNILLNAMDGRKTRLKIYYGDIETGRDWHEEHDTVGYIGKSTGINKLPLLIHNSRSMGGGAIVTGCIVKIKDQKTGRVLYQHPKYQKPTIEMVESDSPDYKFNINIDGKLYSRHRSERSATLLKSKLA